MDLPRSGYRPIKDFDLRNPFQGAVREKSHTEMIESSDALKML